MLSWFTKESSIATAMNGTALTKNNILSVKQISNACLDENIELSRIKPYFTTSGWTAILQAVKRGSEIRMAVWKMQETIRR